MSWKDKWTKFKDGAKYQEISAHVEKNKNVYIAGFTGLASGALIVLLLRGHSAPTLINNTNNVAPVFEPVFNNVVSNGGYMRKIVRCVETDEMWSSVSKAADSAGVSLPLMSQHVNGHTNVIKGLHYVIEGLAAG